MSYAITTIWHERNRFLPAILAVAFSAVLITLQGGLLLGLLSMMSTPVDKSTADVWVGYPGVRSVDMSQPIPVGWSARVARLPGVIRVEPCVVSFGLWTTPATPTTRTTTEACTIIGTRLSPDSIGVVEPLRHRPELLSALAEPNTVVIDESECGRLGIRGVGDRADLFGIRVRVVGLIHGMKSLSGPYVLCSLDTARLVLMRGMPDHVSYLLAKCDSPQVAAEIVRQLRTYPQMSAFTREQFSTRSRIHWMTTTKAGIALAFTALLGLLVGAVVTSQTLYAATVAAQREYATLRAMGIPRWRMKHAVLSQSFWVGLGGILVAMPVTLLLTELAASAGTQVRLHPWIVLGSIAITLTMAMFSGLAALRSVQQVDPAHNIR